MSQAFLPLLTRSRGAIVNVLSIAALAALPIVPAYSNSKAAAFNLTQSLRALLAERGVRGQVMTLEDKTALMGEDMRLLGRLPTLAQAADAAVFVASDLGVLD